MNRYKSDDTCEALGVARALPAPAGHLWELSSGRCLPSAFLSYWVPLNYPHKCICAATGDLTGLRTVCSANWREDCWSEETEIWPRKWSLHLKHRALVLSELNLNIIQPFWGILYPVWSKKERSDGSTGCPSGFYLRSWMWRIFLQLEPLWHLI